MFMFEFIKWKPHLRAYCEGRPLVTSQKLQQTFPCHDGILWRPLRLYWQMHHLVGQNGHNFAFSKSLCVKIEHDRIFNNRVKCQCNTYHYNYIESGQCLAPKLEQPSCPHISLAPCYPMLSKGAAVSQYIVIQSSRCVSWYRKIDGRYVYIFWMIYTIILRFLFKNLNILKKNSKYYMYCIVVISRDLYRDMYRIVAIAYRFTPNSSSWVLGGWDGKLYI